MKRGVRIQQTRRPLACRRPGGWRIGHRLVRVDHCRASTSRPAIRVRHRRRSAVLCHPRLDRRRYRHILCVFRGFAGGSAACGSFLLAELGAGHVVRASHRTLVRSLCRGFCREPLPGRKRHPATDLAVGRRRVPCLSSGARPRRSRAHVPYGPARRRVPLLEVGPGPDGSVHGSGGLGRLALAPPVSGGRAARHQHRDSDIALHLDRRVPARKAAQFTALRAERGVDLLTGGGSNHRRDRGPRQRRRGTGGAFRFLGSGRPVRHTIRQAGRGPYQRQHGIWR